MIVWIAFLVAGVLLASTGYLWRQQRAPVRVLLVLAGIALLFVSWWQYDVWATQNRITTSVFQPQEPRNDGNLQTVFDDDALDRTLGAAPDDSSDSLVDASDIAAADNAGPEAPAAFFPEAAPDNPFASRDPAPVSRRDEGSAPDPFASVTYDARAEKPADENPARPAPSAPRSQPEPPAPRSRPATEAQTAEAAPVKRAAAPRTASRSAAPPAPDRIEIPEEPSVADPMAGWRSSQEIIGEAPRSGPIPGGAQLYSPMNDACRGHGGQALGGVCVTVENALGPGQMSESLQLFIEGRPVGALNLDAGQPRMQLPIHFTHPGRFGYRLVGEVRYRDRIVELNSDGVLVARPGLQYDVRMVPGEARVFLEPRNAAWR